MRKCVISGAGGCLRPPTSTTSTSWTRGNARKGENVLRSPHKMVVRGGAGTDLQPSFSVGEDGVESMRRLMKPAEGRTKREDENETTRAWRGQTTSVDTLPVGMWSEMTMIPWGRRDGT